MGVLRFSRLAGFLLTVLAAAMPKLALAQEILLADRGPRFLLAASSRDGKPVEIQAGSNAMLRRVVSLKVEHPTVGTLLDAIERQTGLRFYYGRDVVSPDRPVALRADSITVAAALMGILVDTGVDVLLSRAGPQVALVKQPPRGVSDTGTIVGRVTAKVGNTPLAGATVIVEGTRRSATTGNDGSFRIGDVPAGTYTVRARYIGYAPRAAPVTVSAGQETTADFSLEKSVQRLDEVVTTGTVVPTEVKALPTPISVVTAQQIEQQNLQRLDQVFRGTVPGAFAFDQGQNDSYSTVNVRGTSCLSCVSSVKTYIDGVEMADPTVLAQIDPNSVERMEITRGPEASTVYGAGAINGVLQIFTKNGVQGSPKPVMDGKAAIGLVQSGYGTSAVRQEYSGDLSGGTPGLGYHIGGTFRRTGPWVAEYSSKNPSFIASARTTQGRVELDVFARYANLIQTTAWNPDLRALGITDFSQPPYDRFTNRSQTYGARLSFSQTPRWRHTLSIGYDAVGSDYVNTRARFTVPADSFLQVERNTSERVSVLLNTALTVPLGRRVWAAITAGGEHFNYFYNFLYTPNATRNEGSVDGQFFVTRNQVSNTGIFSQAQLGLDDRLFLTMGLRAEKNSSFGSDYGLAFAPRVGLAYVATAGAVTAKIRGSYGDAIRPPEPGQSEPALTAFARQVAAPDLSPERQRGFDVGFDVTVGTTASAGVTYYRQTVADLVDNVSIDFTTTPPTYQYQNVGRIRNAGVEVEGSLSPVEGVTVSGTVAVANSSVLRLSPTYSGDLRVGDRLIGFPRFTAGAQVSATLLRGTVLSGGLTYIGEWTQVDLLAINKDLLGGGTFRGAVRDYWIVYPSVAKVSLGLAQTISAAATAFVHVDNVGNNLRRESSNATLSVGRVTTVGLRLHQ